MKTNYLKHYFKSFFVVLMFCFGLSSAWGQTYELVTSSNDLEVGAEYIIAGTRTNNTLWVLSSTQANNNRAALQRGLATSIPEIIDLDDETYSNSNLYATIVLGASNGKWTLYDSNTNGTGTSTGGSVNGAGGNVGYLYPVAGQNYLRTSSTVTSVNEWTITIDENNIASIQTTVNNRAIKLNTSTDIFSSYTSGQRDIYLYKKQVESSNEPTLSVSEEQISGLNYAFGNGPSVAQSLVLSGENLDGTDVSILVDEEFEISLSQNLGYSNELNLTDYDGSEITIWVRLASGQNIGSYAGNILVSGGGAQEDLLIELSGNVLAVPSIEEDIFFATVGVSFNQQIQATEDPTSYTLIGSLPDGLSFDTETGIISGIPTVAGEEFEFQITATNLAGTSSAADFLISIQKGTQIISNFNDLTKVINEEAFDLTELTNAGLVITYSSSDENVATINGNVVTIVGIGTTTITATQAGDANWNPFSQEITLTVTEAPIVPKVIISQVYEGASNNKWIEITNVGTTTVDLSEIQVAMWNVSSDTGNGNINGVASFITPLTGTLASGASYLLKNSGASTTVPHNPMPAASFTGVTSVVNFNGNDALALLDLEGNIIDAFGHGINNKDKSFHRKAEVLSPNATFTLTEWEERTLANIAAATPTMTEYIGTHIYGASGVVWTTDNEWLGGVEPTIEDDVTIEGTLVITEELSAKSITVAEGASCTVASGATLTVDEAIVNNGAFVVESGANLIQNSTAVNEGTFVVKRNATIKHLDYTIWSSPVANQGLQAFSPNTLPNRIYTYDTIGNEWTQATGNFVAGQGYMFRAPNVFEAPYYPGPYTYEGTFTGELNNGDVTANFTAGTYQSLGNPYPSNISREVFHTTNANVGTLYFWTNTYAFDSATGEYEGINWTTITRLGLTVPAHIPGEGGNSGMVSNGYISVGQGFVAQTVNAITSVTFNNDMRVSDAANFFRTAAIENHNVRLNLSSNNQYINQTLINYSNEATNEEDFGVDAKLFNYTGSALYSLISNQADSYIIQSRALPFTDSDVVALGFRAVNAGSYTISLDSFEGLFEEGQDIFLVDNFTQVTHNLKEASYTFVSEVGEFNSRFSVVYRQDALSVTNPNLDNNWVVFAQNGQFQIATQGIELKEVVVFDTLGRKVYQSAAEGNAHIVVSDLPKGVMIVQITTAENQILTKKTAK